MLNNPLRKRALLLVCLLLPFALLQAQPPTLEPRDVKLRLKEMMRAHVQHKQLDLVLAGRALSNYVNLLDPAKTYLTADEVDRFIHPTQETLERVLHGYDKSDYSDFFHIHSLLEKAIARRDRLDEALKHQPLPEDVTSEEFQDLDWAENEKALSNRLLRLRALQLAIASRLEEESPERVLQRLEKRRRRQEVKLLGQTPQEAKQIHLAYVLKATASALDTQTAYFTPDEAADFIVQLQQRLFGIGVQLRDSLDGFRAVRIIEGGPADREGRLRVNDRIIAVDGEPVIGTDIVDVVQLIRGPAGSSVTLTVLREQHVEEEIVERRHDIPITRGEVVLKETRIETSQMPYGDGIIGRIALYSFYQDQNASSTSDVKEAIEEFQKKGNLKGIILDLRQNGGGLLPQAIGVTGLFITKGIVASIKDSSGRVQHLRDVHGEQSWDGPLIVLTSRLSASAAEIVAQALQDYRRALVVGDETTFGKGTFQTSTLDAVHGVSVDPKGEYKVTRGRYYTVSGKSPQLVGVQADVVVPGLFSSLEVGERFAKHPLENDRIKENFHDDLSDIPFLQRIHVRETYHHNLQSRLECYTCHLEKLRENSMIRQEANIDYQDFLSQLQDEYGDEITSRNDHQLHETFRVMGDLIYLCERDKKEAA